MRVATSRRSYANTSHSIIHISNAVLLEIQRSSILGSERPSWTVGLAASEKVRWSELKWRTQVLDWTEANGMWTRECERTVATKQSIVSQNHLLPGSVQYCAVRTLVRTLYSTVYTTLQYRAINYSIWVGLAQQPHYAVVGDSAITALVSYVSGIIYPRTVPYYQQCLNTGECRQLKRPAESTKAPEKLTTTDQWSL